MRVEFILNHETVALQEPRGLLLDWLRQVRHLTATKEPCHGGECGACQVLIGQPDDTGQLRYRSHNSCLLPLAALHGRHVLTLEGLNQPGLSPVQQALLDGAAIQCGYCTPGVVMALTGWLLDDPSPQAANGLDWLSGNLCRCTGYGGFHRAVEHLAATTPAASDPLARALQLGLLPADCADVAARLAAIPPRPDAGPGGPLIAGATDLAVEQPALWHAAHTPARLPAQIELQDGALRLGAGTTIEALRQHPLIQQHAPVLKAVAELFGSRPIRHQASLGGNLAHASPIADFAVALLALAAELECDSGRRLPLSAFYLGYKHTALAPGEQIRHIHLPLPTPPCHFEKAARRAHFDIASLNSAMSLALEGDRIAHLRLSVGGAGPVPMRLTAIEQAAQGLPLSPALVQQLAQQAADAIAPLDDVRGSADYRRALLRRQLIAHFEALAPALATGAPPACEQRP